MLGLQGIVNPLLSGSQAAAATTGLTGFGTGQTGLGTSQASFPPPGFAPPGLAQSAPPPSNVNPGLTGQASQSGLTTPLLAPASVSSVAGSTGQTGFTSSQQVLTTSGDLSVCGQAAHQTPPTSMTSSTHPVENSTHSLPNSVQSSEDTYTTSLPSTATNTGRSARQTKSSSISFSSLSDHSARSSLSSEGEPLQSSHKTGRVAGATNADSCVTDSSESEGGRTDIMSNGVGAARNGGECQLFYSGGSRNPSWQNEKAFIKR